VGVGASARRDRRLVWISAFVRSTATALVGIELGLYLSVRGLPATEVGLVVAAGLAGATLAALAATLFADAHGRRRTLIEVGLLSAGGAVWLATASAPAMLALAAFVGMLNGMGRDRGASLVVDLAILPTTVPDAERTRTIAVYNVAQDAGHACGALLAGLPQALSAAGLTRVEGHRASFLLYALLLLVAAAAQLMLSPAVEGTAARGQARVSAASRRILVRISSLFALDSLGGGMLSTALLTYFFFERFGASEVAIAALFAAARVLNALSHLGAAWLSRRIGLVNTMVFTHLPSSLLLVSVAYAPSFAVAAVLFILREGLVEMDVPTRQSYVLAVVRPEERTFASGVTNLVRMAMWAVAPALGGALMDRVSLMTPLVLGAAAKIVYDLLLWRAFRAVKPPEELQRAAAP
jgi:MFS family permease